MGVYRPEQPGGRPKLVHPNEPWKDKWEMVSRLGRGGQGETWLVKHLSGKPERAVLKLLNTPKDEKARQRMFQEVSNLKIVHGVGGKVPRVLDDNAQGYEDLDTPLFFVMEYLPGKLLSARVKEGLLPLADALAVGTSLCSTLKLAHANGVLHRDIKPNNMVLGDSREPEVWLLDFGLSFHIRESADVTSTDETIVNSFLGLPERRIAGADRRDPKSDVTCVCAIIHHCLTNCCPGDLLDAEGLAPHRRQGYQLPASLGNERQLRALNTLFDRGFAQRIAERFQSVEELIERLVEVTESREAQKTPEPALVASRKAEALMAANRTFQLTVYDRNMASAWSAVTRRYQELVSEIVPFTIAPGGPWPENKIMTPPGQDPLAGRLAFVVRLPNLPNQAAGVQYSVSSIGPECTLHRTLLRSEANKEWDVASQSVVHRFRGDQEPDSKQVVRDFDAAVSACVEMFG